MATYPPIDGFPVAQLLESKTVPLAPTREGAAKFAISTMNDLPVEIAVLASTFTAGLPSRTTGVAVNVVLLEGSTSIGNPFGPRKNFPYSSVTSRGTSETSKSVNVIPSLFFACNLTSAHVGVPIETPFTIV